LPIEKTPIEEENKLKPQDYFEYYCKNHQFDYEPYNSVRNEFDRLAGFMKWKEDLDMYKSNFKKFNKVLKRYLVKTGNDDKFYCPFGLETMISQEKKTIKTANLHENPMKIPKEKKEKSRENPNSNEKKLDPRDYFLFMRKCINSRIMTNFP